MTSIAIGADEAGAPLKEHLARYMRDAGYEIKDFGNGTEQDYPDVAAEVAEAVAAGEHDRALLVCGTGLEIRPVAEIAFRRKDLTQRYAVGEMASALTTSLRDLVRGTA